MYQLQTLQLLMRDETLRVRAFKQRLRLCLAQSAAGSEDFIRIFKAERTKLPPSVKIGNRDEWLR